MIQEYIDLFDKITSHAILLNVDESYDTSFSKEIVKKYIMSKINNEDFLNDVFYKIDNDIYEDLFIIRSDGNYIKKDQLLELMTEFKNKSFNSDYRFYIIEYVELLNSSAANSILKFLEEPENNIIAILVTKNINNVLSTIISRCQIFNLNFYKKKNYGEEYIFNSINYLKKYEQKKSKSISYLSDLYSLKSEDLILLLNSFEYLYDMYLNCRYCNFKNLDEKYIELFQIIDYDNVIRNINCIEKMINLLKMNVNSRIVLDLFFIGGD